MSRVATMQPLHVLLTLAILAFPAVFSRKMTLAEETASKINVTELMEECNATYRIDNRYWNDLLHIGRFSDESDDTPMCFLHCMMDRTGMMDANGAFDEELVKVIFRVFPNNTEEHYANQIVDICIGQRDESDLCRRSYDFVKCVITEEIMRSADHTGTHSGH